MAPPRMVVTGCPDQIGRHLADAARGDWQVYGIADCAPSECGAPVQPNITWFEVDIADRWALDEACRQIAAEGAVDAVFFLTVPTAPAGAERTEQVRINETGLAHVLEASRRLDPKRFVLASPQDDGADEAVQSILAEREHGFPVSRIRFEPRSRIVIVGASGFVGRNLVEAFREDYQVIGLARSSQQTCGLQPHPNVVWHQVDICDRRAVETVFRKIRDGGGADFVFHLAAYYDFSGGDHPEYRRTNVDGLAHVLDATRQLAPEWFVFASSVAASDFPAAGAALDESSPPNGDHAYAVSKRLGEEMLAAYEDAFPSLIVRLGAVYSDWCEYPPVFAELERWRARAPGYRILGGRGRTAIPYIHVRDVQAFFLRLVGRADSLEAGEVLVASTDEPVTQRELFETATRCLFGDVAEMAYVPKLLCGPVLFVKDVLGRALGSRPFERPWMARYIDREMIVSAARTRGRLDWCPRERFDLRRRLPFLVENQGRDPGRWHRRNQAILRRGRTALNLRVHGLLEKHEQRILACVEDRLARGDPERRPPRSPDPAEARWTHRSALHQLANAVRTRDVTVYLTFCRDLAERRLAEGFLPDEICTVLRAVGEQAVEVLLEDPEAKGVRAEVRDRLTMTTRFGCDQVEECFDERMRSFV